MPRAISVIKLKLQVDDSIKYQLDGQSRICNWLYNTLLEKANELRSEFISTQDPGIAKTLYSKYGLRDLVPNLKQKHCFLNVVHSSPLKNAALRLRQSIKNYQDSKKGRGKGKERGWPKFRSWRGNWFSLLYDEPNKGFKIIDDTLHLSLGTGNKKEARYLAIRLHNIEALKNKNLKNCQICNDGKEYFAIFNVESDYPEAKMVNKMIAFDPNHKNLLYGVDITGNAIEVKGLTWLKVFDKRIDELKSKRDKCNKKSRLVEVLDYEGNTTGNQRWQPSRRWVKYDNALQEVYRKRREQIKAFCYTLANELCRKYDLISVGDYTPHGGGITKKMRRAMNNRSVIGKFKQTLSWVAFKSGKSYMEYLEAGTTRTCHNCQSQVDGGLTPDIRSWECAVCKTKHHRDENAAINGLCKTFAQLKVMAPEGAKVYANLLASVPGSGPVISVGKRWAWSVLPRGVCSTPRGQNRSIAASSRKLNRQCGNCLPIHAHAA